MTCPGWGMYKRRTHSVLHRDSSKRLGKKTTVPETPSLPSRTGPPGESEVYPIEMCRLLMLVYPHVSRSLLARRPSLVC